MNNPWEEISLNDYENHMSLDSVKQLQAMNSIMKEQFEAYPVSTAMVLGVAGGNGLEHVSIDKFRTVYGVDINGDYLRAVSERYVDPDYRWMGIATELLYRLTTYSYNEANPR